MEKSLQNYWFESWSPSQESHGDRTPSFAVMRYRLKCRTQKMPFCRYFPTNQADAGTRTPDPIITSNEISVRSAHG
jgi:hypothetical protein